jgi:hypothetical protein
MRSTFWNTLILDLELLWRSFRYSIKGSWRDVLGGPVPRSSSRLR